MNTLKRFALLCALVCALAVSSLAQSASDITISGVLYNAFNDPCTSCTFTVTVTRRDGVAVQSAPKTVTSNSSTGAISFTLPRKSLVLFLGNYSIGKHNLKQGVTFFIPDQASADITDLQSVEDAIASLTTATAAPSTADFIVGTANASLSAEQSLGALTTGLLKNTVSGSTGTLSTAVAADLPLISTLTADASPDGAADYVMTYDASAGAHKKVLLNNLPGSGGSSGITVGTTTITSGTSGRIGYNNTGVYGEYAISGTGSVAMTNSPTLVTPALGTPSVAVLTNATGLPISTGVSGLGTGVATALAINTGGAGAVVLLNGALGTPSSGTATNLTGLPISTGLTGAGTGVLTALAVSIGSSGAFVVNGGALGTPSSGTLTNATGLPISTGVSGLGTGVATFLGAPSSANLASALTDETGSGAAVFGTSPDFTTGATIGGVAIPTISSTNTLTNKTISGSSNTLSNIANASLTNSAITINAGTNFGITAPGSSSLGATVTIGATTDNLRFANLGLGVASPTSGGQIASTLGANNVTGLLIKRNTDTSPTGKFFDFQNAAGTTLASMGVDGALTVASCTGCGGSSGITIGTTTITSGTSGRVLYDNAGVVGEMTTSGTGTQLALTASPTFTGTVAGAAFTASSTITSTQSINATSTDGLILANTTAAAAGAQQWSPRLRFTGQGWKTNATAASQTVDWIIENQPVQGAANPTANLILASQVNAGGYTGNFIITSGGQIQAGADGSISAPIYSRSGSTNTGMYFPGTNQIGLVANGTSAMTIGSGSINYATGVIHNWNADLFFRRGAAATFTFGAADAASPVAQTLSVQNVVAGTSNTAGATWTHQASLQTGNALPGRFHVTGGALSETSATTQRSAVDRLITGAAKVLTNNSAITILNVTNASNTNAGGVLDYCVEVADATDVQYECGMVTYGISNKGGVFSGNTATKFGNHQNATSGTLTVTFAISGANPGALSVNANSSLTPSTGYPRITYSLHNLGQQAVSVQ